MIDLGFTKLALIGVVALVVVGPERLPKVARMAGSLFGRAQRYMNEVKAEVSREIELDELRKMQTEMQEAASEVEQSIAKDIAEIESELQVGRDFHGEEQVSPDQLSLKARSFRKKRLARTSAIPAWYKKQHGRRSRVLSAAARVARFRPGSLRRSSSFF